MKPDVTHDTLLATTPAGAEPESASVAQPPAQKTKGEKLYDTFLYGGVGYVANFVLSVAVGHFFLKGGGRNFFNKSEKLAEENLSKLMPAEAAHKVSKEGVRILALGAGGHAVMVPIKYLEDKKRRFVYWINRTFFPSEYGTDAPNKPLSQLKDEELPQLVENPAHMSWGKTIMRRLAIYVGIASALAPFGKANSWVEDKVHKGLVKGLDVAAESTQLPALQSLKKSKTFSEVMEISSSDLYVSAIAAFLVRMTNGAHGLFKSKKAAPAPAQEAQPEALPATAPTTDAVSRTADMPPVAEASFAAKETHKRPRERFSPAASYLQQEQAAAAERSGGPAIA
jgi:hypothetical protein